MRKVFLALCLVASFLPVVAQNDVIKSTCNAIMDICHAPEFSLQQRIDWGAEKFDKLLELSQRHADEGDTELLVRAYESFASLFTTQEDMAKLDKWNRHFVEKMDLKNPLHFNCYLFLCAAYTNSEDVNHKSAMEAFSYKGDAKLGIKFMDDFPLSVVSLELYDQARFHALKATLNLYGGNYDEAATGFNAATKLVEKVFGKESAEFLFFRMFEELPAAYKKDYATALSIASEVEKAMKAFHLNLSALGTTLHGTDYQEYCWLLYRMASYCRLLDKKTDEMAYNKKALDEGYENCVFDGNLMSGYSSKRMIFPYQALGLPPNGPEQFLKRDLFSIKEAVANNEYEAGSKKESLEMYKELLGDYKIAANDTKGYNKVDISTIKQMMEPLVVLAPLCAHRFPDNSNMIGTAYDCALQYKNFCLFTDNLVQYLATRDRDAGVRKLYAQLNKAIEELDHVSTENAPAKRDEIVQLREQLLVELDFSTLGTLVQSSWQTVQDCLPTQSVAIEFMLCQLPEGKKVYQALVLHPKGAPKYVELCDEKDLTALSDIYTTPNAYSLIWKPLANELADVKNIYFSPTGQFHKIAIEYLPDDEGKNIGQIYNMYRLSSTRNLSEPPHQIETKQCVVYGGILYDLPEEGGGTDTDLAPEVLDNQNLRSGISYLPQTLEEMQNVSNIMKASFDVDNYSAENATEESFKGLSGKKLKVLHVATHGFYVPKHRKSAITKLTKNPFNSLEDQSLSLSGIMMAGANNTLSKKFMKGEDGILTAKEISRMDMRGMDLVVLSACETGLGEVSDEGVFGLQRGLKKAGVNTILMSLWEVDDEATQVLMSMFYSNYTKGMSKRKAFMEAQQYLREKDNKKFDDPRFWAAFIMLDAVD